MRKRILVIIVTWNGMKWIQQCLDSLQSSVCPVETLVVDNGSSDGTVSFVQSHYPEVEIVETGTNLGFGQANNVGLRKALEREVDFVYLLNQDAYVFPDMFDRLVDVALDPTYDSYSIFSPLHIHGDKLSLDEQFKEYIGAVSSTIVEDSCLSAMKAVYPVGCVPAAGWLLPIKTIKTIGGFDPIFFHYGEDHHYAQRVAYHGYRIGVVPAAKMIHDRDGFGNAAMANKGAVARSIKTEILLNINLSKQAILRKLLKLFFLFSYESVRCALKGDFRSGAEYFMAFWSNLFELRRYRKNRRENRRTGSLWI